MASNSTENPAPIENISIFNPAEWDNTDKSTTTTTTTELATLSGDNIFSGYNDFSFGLKAYNNNFIINNSYQLTGSQIITSATSTLTTPLSPVYLVNLTANTTITLPTPSILFENCKIIFRRLNASNLSALTNSFDIYNNVLGTTTTILFETPSVPTTTAILSCMYIASINSYQWAIYFVY